MKNDNHDGCEATNAVKNAEVKNALLLFSGGYSKRYWSQVDKSPHPKGCWIWIGGREKSGYGIMKIRGKSQKCHRLAYRNCVGLIPAERENICHTCDNPPCCNPAHLWAGTDLENNQDMWRKGRANVPSGEDHWIKRKPELMPRGDAHWARIKPEFLARGDRNGSRLHPERLARGDRNPMRLHPESVQRGIKHKCAILDDDKIREIRKQSSVTKWGNRAELGRKYGVSWTTIQNIIERKKWAHVV